MLTSRKFAIVGAMLLVASATLPRAAQPVPAPAPKPRFDGSLSVLTYNVKGMPWPAAVGRPKALKAIGAQLLALHRLGRAPQVVVLQEAFTDEAREIGAEAGYRYAARGPSSEDTGSAPMSRLDQAHAAAAHWWTGETEGKLVDSGLEVLSDYPITTIRRMAFPDFACAGFDCLANKGALLVTVNVPGAATPVDVLTTHLNSRRASHVDDARSNYAYGVQVAALTRFVQRYHDPRLPLIAAGDYNVGEASERRTELLAAVHRAWVPGHAIRDALGAFRQQGGTLPVDAAYSFQRARDWQFFTDGTGGRLSVAGIEVPFGHDPSGNMLSDHVGYIARFRLDAPTTTARASAPASAAAAAYTVALR